MVTSRGVAAKLTPRPLELSEAKGGGCSWLEFGINVGGIITLLVVAPCLTDEELKRGKLRCWCWC